VKCASKLIEFGAIVTQPTSELPKQHVDCCTAFHLAARTLAHERQLLVVKSTAKVISESPSMLTESKESQTYKMLDLLLAKLPLEKLSIIVDDDLGSVLHYLAAVDHLAGIRKLVGAPYNHPYDILNNRGDTPLLMGIQSYSWSAVFQLLDLDVDVNRRYGSRQQTALQFITLDWLATEDKAIKGDLARVMAKLFDKGRLFCVYGRSDGL
jgi:hypothetical protein